MLSLDGYPDLDDLKSLVQPKGTLMFSLLAGTSLRQRAYLAIMGVVHVFSSESLLHHPLQFISDSVEHNLSFCSLAAIPKRERLAKKLEL